MAKHSGNLTKNYNIPDKCEEDPILERLQEELLDLSKDVELNYSRLYYKNPMINLMLKMIARVLKEFAAMIDTPQAIEHSETPYTKKDKFTFGTSKNDFS